MKRIVKRTFQGERDIYIICIIDETSLQIPFWDQTQPISFIVTEFGIINHFIRLVYDLKSNHIHKSGSLQSNLNSLFLKNSRCTFRIVLWNEGEYVSVFIFIFQAL